MSEIAFHELSVSDGNPQVYNGGDNLQTAEVWEKINSLPHPRLIYDFERSLQGVALEMMLRGFKVDLFARESEIHKIKGLLDQMDSWLKEMSQGLAGTNLNYGSSKQLKDFFYGFLRIPPFQKWVKGELKTPMDSDTLEKFLKFPITRPIARAALVCRGLRKTLETLQMGVDDDCRMRTSINIAGTREARWSTSASFLGTGGNLQNITQDLRHIFVADEGWKLCGVDKEQAESRWVGFICGILFDDWSYLDAAECLTAEHEVLTPKGWRSIADKPETILVWDKGNLWFENPIRWNEGETDDLITFEGRAMYITGTGNHKMPVMAGRWANNLEPRTLKDMAKHPSYKSPITGTLCENQGRPEPMADLLAAFQADGTRDSHGKVHWTFMKERKIFAMGEILDSHNLKYSKYILNTGAVRFYLHAGQGQDKWNKNCGPEILEWNLESLQEFYNSHCIWDAHIDRNTVSIVNQSKEHLEWLATAFMLCGKATTIHPHKSIYWKLTVKTRDMTQYKSCTVSVHNGEAMKVYCPTVSTGYFMCRRGDRIFVSGNSGDLHTIVARSWVDELPWTGELKSDRVLADRPFGDDTYRQASKILNHASVIMGKPPTIAIHTKIPAKTVEKFQKGFFSQFPCIPRLHTWIAGKIQSTGFLTNPFGRRRDFFGRPNDDSTIRQGMAFTQASPNADDINLGLYRMWSKMGSRVQILTQEHDAIYFQFQESDDELDVVRTAQEHLKVEFDLGFRKFSVPTEAKTGYNKGPRYKFDSHGTKIESNPKGLDKPGAKR